ncbi:SPOR domain-containing protein [Alishewanella sp. BS5-314]|uniref:SPOR domain-containing protein n=1 Tax=Alishewanella sp. BS5-314 TaxID=2755587 RepID=UPI0021BB3310|nr:SPOR domain-containing protein [Alishewanella sp. BS5-314]MCT8124643.1 SPOR domain-containing protein [Alishewanella sp. BS5-314]
MPQKDYVRATRPKAPAKGQARGSRAKAPAASNKPWLLIALTLLTLSVFVYGLWFLKQQPVSSSEPVAAPVKAPAKDELPPKPQSEPYQYIKELENREITVEVPEQQRSVPAVLQCGSFRQQGQAEQMKAQIAFAGITADVRRTEGSNGVWFRVVVGPYESRRAATADMNRLRQMGINTCQVRNWT